MEKEMRARDAVETTAVGSFDFIDPVEMVKAIDLTMRQYFGVDDWPAARNREFPGLTPRQ